MTKYKLEYIWLDGYTPAPNLRGKTQIKEFDSFPVARAASAVGLRRQLDQAGRRPQLRLRAEADPRLSGRRAHERRARDVRSHDAGRRHAAPVEQAGDHPRRRGRLVRLRAGIFPLQGRPAARLPGRRLSRAAGPLLHRRRLHECRRRSRARSSRSISTSASPPGINHEGINAEVAKGQWEFQIFGKGSKTRRRRDVDGPLSAGAADREIRRRRRVSLQAARRHRLERLGHARQLLHRLSARGRRQGVFRGADGGVREEPRGSHRGLRAGQPHAADRQARDRSRSTSSATASPTAAHRSACRTASSRTTTGAIWKIAVPTRRATPTRSPRRS